MLLHARSAYGRGTRCGLGANTVPADEVTCPRCLTLLDEDAMTALGADAKPDHEHLGELLVGEEDW